MKSDLRAKRTRASAPRCRDERGMNTAEYALGTVAACGFAGLLFLCQAWFADVVRELAWQWFQEVPWWLTNR